MVNDAQHQHYAVGMALNLRYGWAFLANIGENKVVAISTHGNRIKDQYQVVDPDKITYDEVCHIYEMSNEHDIGVLKLNYKFDDNQQVTHNVYTTNLLRLGDVVITKDGGCAFLAQVGYGRACIVKLDGTVVAPSVPIPDNPNVRQDEYCKMGGSLDDYCVGTASAVLV